MTTSRRRLVLVLTLAALCSILSTALPAQAQTGTICKCEDIAQIQYRIQQDANVIVSYGDWVLKHPDELTESSVMQEAVLKEMNGLDGHNNALDSPFSGNGKLAATSGPFCDTTPPTMDLTPCLKHALDLHEAVHRDYCDRTHGNWHLYTATAGEEIRAYGTERNFLVAEEKRLLCNCDYYALKLEQTVDINWQGPLNTQVEHWELWSAVPSVPTQFVKVPLQVTNGAVSGSGSGTIRVSIHQSSSIMPCTATVEPKAGQFAAVGSIDDAFSVKGTLSKAFAPTLATKQGDLVYHTECQARTSSTGSGTTRFGASGELPLSFTKIDESFDQPFTTQGETIDFKATLIVNDKWVGVKAADHRGATVDAALRVIGLTVDC